MDYTALAPGEFSWVTRPHREGEPARHVAELSERLGLAGDRANVWRYEPGASGRRHRHRFQAETFVVLRGTLSMYLGEPPELVVAPTGGVIHVSPGTPLQTVNEGTDDLLVYVHGLPPEDETAELLDSAIDVIPSRFRPFSQGSLSMNTGWPASHCPAASSPRSSGALSRPPTRR